MQDFIGTCDVCNENVYCENGFFDGVHVDGNLYCSNCGEKMDNDYHK
jgi:transposase